MISTIIVTYNCQYNIQNCLNSIRKKQNTESEVILVDNGSKDQTINVVYNHLLIDRLIKNKKNLGFAAATSQGAKVDSILRCITIVAVRNSEWNPPREYLEKNVSDTVINILLGYNASNDSY